MGKSWIPAFAGMTSEKNLGAAPNCGGTPQVDRFLKAPQRLGAKTQRLAADGATCAVRRSHRGVQQ